MFVAVINQKGGVGKTTLATHMAAAAVLDGDRVLLLDLGSGSALDWHAVRKDGSALRELITLRGEPALSPCQLAELASDFDVTIIDGPPPDKEVPMSAAVAADIVLVPVRPSPYDLWATAETITLLDRADDARAALQTPPVRRCFVINAASPGAMMTREAAAALERRGARLATVIVHQRVAFAEVAAVGESVLTLQPKGAAAAEIRALFSCLRASLDQALPRAA